MNLWGVSGAFYTCAAISGAVTLLAAAFITETHPPAARGGGGAPEAKGPAAGNEGKEGKEDPPPARAAGAAGAAGSGGGEGFGVVIWACTGSMFCNAFCFSIMNGLAAITINVQLGWGPTETGIFRPRPPGAVKRP